MKLFVCGLLLVAVVAVARAAPMDDGMQQHGDAMMVMLVDDPMMHEQQPQTLEDMVAVYDQPEMDSMGEMAREKRHHRYGGGYGGYGGYGGGFGGYRGGYGGYRGGYGGYGGFRGGYGGYRRGGFH
ncbi:glycine-rich RNA-binding protein-like [Anopheles merus]|uniref:AGAP009635-PA n=4 Tax=gambiae species complex TaxID=44542 RepID=Q7Q1T8_ANOGA|nr:uncharacterized protein LOC120958550 [Anopheles coluzzii]XP_041778782.1 glycine-rich RNA-binding protein-like [Anopheles merus]XP_318666.4 uncharacterized protein LOC1279009 [Anopheles gambiae]EAA14008.4 AGAP009635-PA [Anopheles gambiae str. PEST]